MQNNLDWDSIHFGKLNKLEILQAVADADWQSVRVEMKGASLEVKFGMLKDWLSYCNYNRRSRIQVTNYINALKRGGLIA